MAGAFDFAGVEHDSSLQHDWPVEQPWVKTISSNETMLNAKSRRSPVVET